MLYRLRRSLLVQLFGLYGLFVAIILGAGLIVSQVVQQQLQDEALRADLALARAIALELDIQLRNARSALTDLARLDDVRTGTTLQRTSAFRAFKTARQDIDRVFWLDAQGKMQVSVPTNPRTIGTDFSQERIFQRAAVSSLPFVEAGVVDLTTYNPVVTLAQPVRDAGGQLLGVVATNLLLDDLSAPLRAITSDRPDRLVISVINEEGRLIATPRRERLLQPLLPELPGAEEALAGRDAAKVGPGPGDQQWLYSSESVPSVGWAVVVQRPTYDALAVVSSINGWLSGTAVLFGLGGLLFGVVLFRRVVYPLQQLATNYRDLPRHRERPAPLPTLSERRDEVGNLARSLYALDRSVSRRLNELHTLLETSSAVVSTLDPQAVAARIITAVRQLVDVQAAAVLVPDEAGTLRVLASEGHSEYYDRTISIPVDDGDSPSALALREGRPVQLIAGESHYFPPISFSEGFRALLAIPIVGSLAGGVALVVYRTQPQRYSPDEIELLLTFANFATLAWEHAVLYERSDERLREVAAENERLYRRANEEKQMLAAIMGSMSDGLALAGSDGTIRYANRRAAELLGTAVGHITGSNITLFHNALRGAAAHPVEAPPLPGEPDRKEWLLELGGERKRVIRLRLFDVRSEDAEVVGRGMLLRDVTREHEIDQFKTTLLGAVGHEVRTPLAAIKGHASTLLQDDVVWSAADERHFLQTISDEADRLAQLVTNLLDLSRIEAGLLSLKQAPWALAALVQRVVQRVQRQANQQIVVEIPPDLPPVSVDAPRIEVVLHNLITNALAYGGDTVWIRAERIEQQLLVQVSDNGGGIDPDELAHLFERFYRAARGVQRRSGGTGLGLAICKAFVEAHGGVIRAESSTTGTMFSFTLQLALAETVAHPTMIEEVSY